MLLIVQEGLEKNGILKILNSQNMASSENHEICIRILKNLLIFASRT